MNVTNARNCLFICEINWQKEKRARKRMFTGLLNQIQKHGVNVVYIKKNTA